MGCLAVCALLAVLVALAFARLAPPTLRNVTLAYGRSVLERIGVVDPLQGNASESDLGFAGHLLTEDQQDVYLQLLVGVRSLKESFAITNTRPEDIDPTFRAIVRDHPELFWIDGSCVYTYASLGDVMNIEPGFTLPLDQVESVRQRIEAEAGLFLAGVPADASEYDKARAAYEYVIAETDYSTNAAQNQNIQSVFLAHESVCAGYARAYQYLLQRMGMECAYVEGSIVDADEDHAWNLVRIDGSYTYVDPTWGDPTYQAEVDPAVLAATRGIIYDYLCLTTEEILRDRHVFDSPADWPACEDASLDWYRREGSFFESYDEQALANVFWRKVDEGASMVAYKFANDESFRAASDALEVGSFLRDDLLDLAGQRGLDSFRYSYSTSDTLRIVRIYW